MGVRLSIDKHVSNLHELLEMSAQYFQKVRFASKISGDIKQHLKIWRFQEDNSKFDAVKSMPIALQQLQQPNSFAFNPKESYLCLFIYQRNHAGLNLAQEQVRVPPFLLSVLQSSLNMLTYDSLNRIVSTNESESVLTARGFTLATGGAQDTNPQNSASEDDEFKYILFVWDGIETSPLTKANALAKAVELQSLFAKAKDAVLKVLFSGGVIRGKKLQRGSVYVMSDLVDQNNQPQLSNAQIDPHQLQTFFERILLLKCIFQQPKPQIESRPPQQSFSKLRELFSGETSRSSYWSRFDSVNSLQGQTTAPTVRSQIVEERKKPMIPNLGPNLGSLGFTSLTNNDFGAPGDKKEDLPQQQQPPVTAAPKRGPSMGLGLNLARVTRDSEERQEPPASSQPQNRPVPTMNLGMISKQPAAAQEEKGVAGLSMPQTSKIPALRLGDVGQAPEGQLSSDSNPAGAKPKLGLGLDLSKAQKLQQQHLTMAEEKKSHARETAVQQMGGLNIGNQLQRAGNHLQQQNPSLAQNTPDSENTGRSLPASEQEFGTPSSQGQGESQRDSNFAQNIGMNNYGMDAPLIVPPEQLNDEDFDYRGTSRKEYENEFYKRVCSEIIDDFLYLGGDLVAKDAETFQNIGITHVINCAADYSDDYHKNMGVVYKSYHLKDHVREDIACVFYDAIQFLAGARAAGGKCYVHCVQGISRSATICCAYMILTEGLTYNQAYERVKARRACANPNLQFIQQLIWFEKRLQDSNYRALTVSPRVFILMSHQDSDPQRIVCKLLTANLYQRGQRFFGLDPRGACVIQAERVTYIWVGGELFPANREPYLNAAKAHLSLLSSYEKAKANYEIIEQGRETSAFWELFGFEEKPNQAYSHQQEHNMLYIDLAFAQKKEGVRNTVVQQMDQYRDQVDQEKWLKAKLFNYPDWDSPVAVFDFEDLENTESMLVLCVRKSPGEEFRDEDVCYVWKGQDFDLSDYADSADMDENQFVQKCVEHYWGNDRSLTLSQVKMSWEQPDEPSDAFMHYFD